MPRPRKPPPATRAAAELARVVPHVARWIERLLAAQEPSLTVAQLVALEAVESGAVGAELAGRSGVSPAAVSQLLAALESAGLVVRARAGDDRRRQVVALTEQGRARLAAARAVLGDGLAPLVATLPPHEVDALAHALARLAEALGASPPPRRPPRPPLGRRRAVR